MKKIREYSDKLSKMKETKDIKVISLDGKVIKGSFDNFKDQKAIQIFSALLNGEIILAHEEIDEKTNEIPIAQKFFEELGLKGIIITLDALHCQKKTFKKIIDSGNDAVIQLKGNQKKLMKK